MNQIRIATPSDARGMLAIYAPYIRHTTLTFETEVPADEAFADRIAHYLAYAPWLVWERDGQLAGYAYASRYRERAGYQWSVESSVYIADGWRRTGVGTALYGALTGLLRLQGFRNVYAVINLPNPQSVAFHERLGFRWMATYPRVGYKLGGWRDVGWWQLILNEYTADPDPPVPFSALPLRQVEDLLREAGSLVSLRYPAHRQK